MYSLRYIQNPVYYRKFRHILPYMAYLEPCVTLAHSEPCHIQNPDILDPKIYLKLCQGMFWCI